MSRGALIIGGSPAGIQAAMELADGGVDVHLVTASPFIERPEPGGLKDRTNTRLLELARHPLVRLWTGTRLHDARGASGAYDVVLKRQPRYVDLAKCTACGDCIEACPVTVAGQNRKAVYFSDGSQPGCPAIDKQGTPPCTRACPGGIPVQGYVALVAQGRFREALDLIEAAIPFPGICGRVCTHPCEINCRRNDIDTPVAIRALKRFLADWAEEHAPRSPGASEIAADARRVAVVGSGPAGMTVADRLARLGHRVSIFERLPVIGGMPAVGIPAYRLPREILEREYRRILELGVEIHLDCAIGPQGRHSIDDLFEMGFEAVCLAVGAHRSLAPHIPGETLPGVVHGIELLECINLAQQTAGPDRRRALDQLLRRGSATRALVLGGGNTAMDVSRSLKRIGLEDVRIVYRRSREQMPAMPEEVADAEAEGIALDFLAAPVEILGDASRGVAGLACQRMRLADADESGRRRPVPIDGSRFELDADLVVLAIGQAPDLDIRCGVALDRRGRVRVDPREFSTSRAGVFAAGDAVTHDRMAVIEAIGMAKQAAAAIDAYLKGHPLGHPDVEDLRLPVAQRVLTEADQRPLARLAPPVLPPEDRIRSFEEVERAYTPEQAVAEAGRCLACGPCSGCLACVAACKPGAIIHDEQPLTTGIHVAAVLYAADALNESSDGLEACQGVQRIAPDDLGAASAAAAALARLSAAKPIVAERSTAAAGNGLLRIGVFVCRCADKITATVDTEAICRQATGWPDVALARELEVSCSPEAAAAVGAAIAEQELNRVVLAACACCPADQACFSCTFQRVRCKENLGVLPPGIQNPFPLGLDPAAMGLPERNFEFVNIREHCAWAHADRPAAASAKAADLVAAAVAKARLPIAEFPGGTDQAARVDPHRCRACYTCVTTCEIDAVALNGSPDGRSAQVDPVRCNGCGSCAARCPSNAISMAAVTESQIDAVLAAVLRKG